MWSPSSRAGTGATITCALLGLYAFVVPWPNNALIPEGVRLALYTYRPPAVAGLVALAIAGLLLSSGPLQHLLRNPTLRRAAAASTFFPAWYGLVAAVRGSLALPVVALYALWSITSFVVFPALIRTRTARDALVFTLAAAGVLVVVVAAFASLSWDVRTVVPGLQTSGLWLLLGEEAPLGFLNGNYYTLIPQFFVVALTYWLATHPHAPRLHRRVALAGILLGGGLVAVAWSRNSMVFLMCFGAVYALMRRGSFGVLWLLGGTAAVAILIAGLIGTTDTSELNRMGTGRLALWSNVADSIVDAPSPATALLAGPMDPIESKGPASYDPLNQSKTYVKLRVDNCHLELFLEAGLIGYVLFALPYLLVAFPMLARCQDPGRDGAVACWWIALGVGLCAQGFFIATIPTFNSPLGLAWAALTATSVALDP